MLSSRLCRYVPTILLVPLFFIDFIAIVHAVEVGECVFDSELASEMKFAENFHGKVNLIVASLADPDSKAVLQNRAEEFKGKYNTAIVWQEASENREKGVIIIDKSGYVRWKHTNKIMSPTIETLKTELAKLKRNIPLPIGSPAPDFSLTEADGKTQFTLSDYKGKKNVLVSLLLQTY